jgi:hypothetical protein
MRPDFLRGVDKPLGLLRIIGLAFWFFCHSIPISEMGLNIKTRPKMDLTQLRAEVLNKQQSLLCFDRAIPGIPEGPSRDQMIAARRTDAEILAGWQRQLVYGPTGRP